MLDGETPQHDDIDLGILLYRRSQDTRLFHYEWALVAVKRPSTYSDNDVHVYEISNGDFNGTRVPWFTKFTIRSLLSDGNFYIGVVHLAMLPMPLSQLDDFIRELGPGQNGYNTKGLGWSNEMWIIRIVESLAEADLVNMPSTIGQFRLNIQERGVRLELMRNWGTDPLPVLNT